MDIDERPHKKRRFFAEASSPTNASLTAETSRPDERDALPAEPEHRPNGAANQENVFDADTFASIVGGHVSQAAIRSLQDAHGNNLERAINAYFDGSWKATLASPRKKSVDTKQRRLDMNRGESSSKASASNVTSPPRTQPALESMPEMRYVGALGVAGWTTTSGSNVIKGGDTVKIQRDRQKALQPGKLGRGRNPIRKTQDVIVRFTNPKGSEIGRLEKDAAMWIGALMDQKVCHFEGHCIYAPDRIRTNETIYLQLKCFLLRPVFGAGKLVKPSDSNRSTNFFEAKETSEERDLRLRQIGLVKLFSEINLQPATTNELTAKHKRDGILQSAEMAEQFDQQDESKRKSSQDKENGGSSPPSEENEDGEELEQDQLDSLYKKAQSFDFNTPEAQPAATFTMHLRKYQRQALHWMLQKETREQAEQKQQSMHPLWEEYSWPTKDAEDKDLPDVQNLDKFYVNPYSGELSLDFPVQEQTCLGGILADEMGLGKTIEMLSLIHSHKSPEHEGVIGDTDSHIDAVGSLARQPMNSSTIKRAPATTLVVAPMSLLAQWASEAEKASKAGTLKVLVYYGSEKGVNLQTICSGSNIGSAPNVIITSYGVVLSEFNSVANALAGNRAASGGLFGVEYWRIILDEAHMIKNRSSKTAKACYELAATHRWVLTGTPIVNRLEDLFSLVRFLRVEPWSNFSFWKTFITAPFEKGEFVRALDVVQTVLEPLVLRRTKDMKTPDGEALVPLPPKTINVEKVKLSGLEDDVYQHIFHRAKRTFAENVSAGTLMKSYTTIFAQILRLRQSCCHPILTRNKSIVADEDDAAAAADIANGLADDMDLGALIERFEADEGEQDASKYGAHVLKQIQDESEMECPICSEEPMEEQAVTGCWHSACKKCLLDYIEHQSAKGELPRCFNCREPINARDVFEVIKHEDDDYVEADESDALNAAIGDGEEDDLYGCTQDDNQKIAPTKPTVRISLRRVNQLSSAKINTLLTQLKRLRKAEPTTKSVVFSQFTSFLDLLAPALTAAGISHLRFDGSMAQKERAKVLADFASRPKFTILLLSLRAGGVGLNLTCAKRVFMMDPWWSFAVEAQAIDRVHRMGQTEEVSVTRFIVEGSIEEKMLKVQERKKFIASSLGMMSEEEKKTQRIEDIKELLS
ncbi:DNA repair protein RAD5 [Fulvia fulva]|uniref:DNA repair protein RAD5 n=1 Tax=Passalora fulva TaxID=5499 RepID=A0A9Q8L8X2_PASFU|nr:DNA repair protein RAD5 [Fulvia fulva]KAK4631128.1 DNA repair protein RAD5 [Fulvia fulva]KAK4632796.1 DNA repair protein RAD5 [Fulvia fulva]UJO13101.1 DNA repair protein RAD5 [Fulvia fulva]WPV11850.1 DNA repair protein RAD5 [Fulvia fulva]WPV26949.1 DNA repair protein RAD5 [Fulvia fulva]